MPCLELGTVGACLLGAQEAEARNLVVAEQEMPGWMEGEGPEGSR